MLRFGRQSTGEPRRVPAQASTGEDAGAVLRRHGARGDRPPRFVIQRHAAQAAPLRLQARARRRAGELGRSERRPAAQGRAPPRGARRGPPARVRETSRATIPAGEYGAGTVEIWDRGTYELLEEKRNGGLTVGLHGERLDGVWTLVPAALDGDPKNWLLLRKDADGTEGSGGRYQPMLATRDGHAAAGRRLGVRAEVGRLPRHRPRLGRRRDLHEPERQRPDERFRDVARAAALRIRSSDAVLDGEICALDERGRSRFSLLQEGGGTLVLVLFDLLELESEPFSTSRSPSAGSASRSSSSGDGGVAGLAAVRRRRRAPRRGPRPGARGRRREARGLAVSTGKAERRLAQVEAHGGPRRSSSSATRKGRGGVQGFGALVAGVHDAGALRWAGNVGTGFSDRGDRAAPLGSSSRSSARSRPLDPVPKMPRVRRRDVVWVEPKLVAEVEFAEWTHEGRLRAPSYLRLRDDKAAAEVRRERIGLPTTMTAQGGGSFGSRTSTSRSGRRRASPRATSSPTTATSPRCSCRTSGIGPFTMKRYPDGWQGKHFFQKNAPSHMPEWIERAPFPASTREGERRIVDYAVVNDDLALLWMANMGCIDLHTWASRVDRPDRPDWVMFDLDPSEGSGFPEVIEVALLVKETLDLLELESYPKTSGSRGIHVLVPIARRHSFEEVREFAGIVAARSRVPIPASRRPSGRSRSAAACSWTRTRTARARRTRPRTRCGRARALPCRRRCAGTRSRPASIRRRSRWKPCSTASRATATLPPACSAGKQSLKPP